MAPETLSSQTYPASDVWAAGVMAYQLLSGAWAAAPLHARAQLCCGGRHASLGGGGAGCLAAAACLVCRDRPAPALTHASPPAPSGYLPFDDPRNPNAPSLSGTPPPPPAARPPHAATHCAPLPPLLLPTSSRRPATSATSPLLFLLPPPRHIDRSLRKHSLLCLYPAAPCRRPVAVIWKGILTEQPSFRRAAWKDVSEEAKDFVRTLLDKVGQPDGSAPLRAAASCVPQQPPCEEWVLLGEPG